MRPPGGRGRSGHWRGLARRRYPLAVTSIGRRLMRITRTRALAALVAAGASAAAIAGTALAVGAADEQAEEVVQACRHPNGGWVRVVSDPSRCRAKEESLSWNVAGPAGPAGPPGPQGDPGPGMTKLDDLDGIACTAEDGGAGTVELDFAGEDTVLFRCVAGGSPPPRRRRPTAASSSSTRSTTTRSARTPAGSSSSRTRATRRPTSPGSRSSSWTAATRRSTAARR
jgi:hypothetical protein